MKKYMKKIIYMFVLGIIFLASSGQVSAAWNTYPSGCPNSLSIGNYSTGEGIQDGSNGCWTRKSVSASAGQTINVAVYYDNTNTTDANNTVINLVQSPAGSMTSKNSTYSFYGDLNSSAGSLSLSQVTANLSTSQTLTFSQSKWYKQGSSSGVSLPNGQTGYEAFSRGLSLGTIAKGDWGTVIFSFSIGTTVVPQICTDNTAINYGGALPCVYPEPVYCTISNFTANPTSITSGQLTTLSWNTENCTSASISTIGGVNISGSRVVSPTQTTTYILTADNKTKSLVVTVNPIPQVCEINNFTANPTSIKAGGFTTLNWNTTNCTNATISNLNYNIPTSGVQNVWPTQTTTYKLTARNTHGFVERSIVVHVSIIVPQICQDPAAINYLGSLPCVYPQLICRDITASNYLGLLPCVYPQLICRDITANNYLGSLPCVYPIDVCMDPSANNYKKSQICIYPPTYNFCRISSFTSSTTSIKEGDIVTLSWNTTNCNSVHISGIGSVSSSGSRSVYPTSTTTYNISASGNSGSDSNSIRIYVEENNNNNISVSTYNPTAVTSTGATLSGFANGNGSRINSWIEFPCYGASYGKEFNKSSINISTPVYSLTPNTTYSYCAVAQNTSNNQIVRGNAVSFRTTGEPVVYVNKNVVTTVATNITRGEAQVNGYITNSNYYNSNVHFEYGTTVNLGLRTASKTTNGNSSFSDYITGLSPNTIYFFQAVGQGSDGTSRGNIEVFRTLANNVVRPIIIQGETIIGKDSPIMLQISNKYELIGKGDIVDYVVTYKNIGNSRLTNPMVQVVIPTNMTLINASRGTYSVDTNTLSAEVENLEKGQEGVIYLQARVEKIPLNSAQIVTTAILVYTSSNGAQENAMAYVMNSPKINQNDSYMGASAFFAGFLSIGFIGWLIILLIILILILIARSFYKREDSGVNISNQVH